ncbi:MAG TPA: riboflavin synthase [Leptospiraceae bacterium]|nr:riboflavin synthase [Leptospiraceae bacterium]HMW06070.1 riboflavin synthase [Leptospiraceae bacterium]HMX33358.1 riboflavin synthase [Leptospiraceae bacterium]HMY31388.1 riboflavin synthase [Leptospiraceae bacterium]HMZ64992.1 riboflavin synthase [Leptospiraceae bacterium]
MFTGLIETTGIILEKIPTNDGMIFQVEAILENNDLKLGDSISINGACQTVTELNSDKTKFKYYSSYKTLELTNFRNLEVGTKVNLERSVTYGARMGGHLVQGHVDGVGVVRDRYAKDDGAVEVFLIDLPRNLCKYVIERGSIAIDGISLTVVSIQENTLELVLIPETIKKTNANLWNKGVIVNIETDLVARYVENMLLRKD